MAAADLVLKTRNAHRGGIVEMVVWRVPSAVPPSAHAFKYRLVFIRNGQRVVGYDNERGKGDHKHLAGQERPYRFVDVDTLIRDFLRDVENLA
jgi:hypothetical protein